MTIYEDENVLQLFFDELDSYNDMENLYVRFKINLNAEIVEKIEGPYSRIWIISIDKTEYKLTIDEDYGSFLTAEKEVSILELKKITPLIEKFIH